MARYKITFEIRSPKVENATMHDFEDWIKYKLGDSAQLACDNPFADFDIEALYGSLKIELQ